MIAEGGGLAAQKQNNPPVAVAVLPLARCLSTPQTRPSHARVALAPSSLSLSLSLSLLCPCRVPLVCLSPRSPSLAPAYKNLEPQCQQHTTHDIPHHPPPPFLLFSKTCSYNPHAHKQTTSYRATSLSYKPSIHTKNKHTQPTIKMKFAATITALSAFVASAAAQGIQIAQPVSILPLLYPLAVEYASRRLLSG